MVVEKVLMVPSSVDNELIVALADDRVLMDAEPAVRMVADALTRLARACVRVPLKLALTPEREVGQIWVYVLRLELATSRRRVAKMCAPESCGAMDAI